MMFACVKPLGASELLTIQNVLRGCPELAAWKQDERGHNFSTHPESRVFTVEGKSYVIEYAMFQGSESDLSFRQFVESQNISGNHPTAYEGGVRVRYTWNNQQSPSGPPWYNISISTLNGSPSKVLESITLAQVLEAVPSLADFKSSHDVWYGEGEEKITFETGGKKYALRMATCYGEGTQKTFEEFVNGSRGLPSFKESKMPFGSVMSWVLREIPGDMSSKMLAVVSFGEENAA